MKTFRNTFIRISPDCPEAAGTEPPVRGASPPLHLIHLNLLRERPYRYTHEELVLEGELRREPATGGSRQAILARLRAKPLPCLRTSPLAKRYGWGFHFDAEGRIAAYPAGSAEYRKLLEDNQISQVSAVRSKRA